MKSMLFGLQFFLFFVLFLIIMNKYAIDTYSLTKKIQVICFFFFIHKIDGKLILNNFTNRRNFIHLKYRFIK